MLAIVPAHSSLLADNPVNQKFKFSQWAGLLRVSGVYRELLGSSSEKLEVDSRVAAAVQAILLNSRAGRESGGEVHHDWKSFRQNRHG